MTKRAATVYLGIIGLMLAGVAAIYIASFRNRETSTTQFDGERALADVHSQVAFGPRTPGSPGHAQVREWMRSELETAGWTVEVQASNVLGHPVYNLVAKRSERPPEIILGAHYDTRFHADEDPDPDKRLEPVPGANDGASGVAVLLELARTLPGDTLPVWIVMFDAEDNGRIEGWDWILGSRTFVAANPVEPQAVVILDMIGDESLNIHYEANSDPIVRGEIWSTAAQLGYENYFIPEVKYNMLDDHTPFVEAGLPAVDVIDFDYRYWHTVADTSDKVSAESLRVVGETVWTWIVSKTGDSE